MKESMRWKLGVVQMDCVLGDRAANLRRIEAFAQMAGRAGIELVVFPETVTTGYFVADRLAELAEPADGPTARELSRIAAENRLHMALGANTVEDGRYYDAQLLFGPDGALLAHYRKVHLFSAEREWYSAGNEPMVVETSLGRVGLSICYDLIFGDYIRTICEAGADIVINSTNWIADSWQREVWGFSGVTTEGLAATRALENGTVLAMANRVGREAGFDSLGHSCIAGPSGRILASITAGEGLAIAEVSYSAEDLGRWRALATYRADRRPELYTR